MSITELEQYFKSNDLPKTAKLNKAATILNMNGFIETNLLRINAYKGDIDKCPSYWHLVELVKVHQSTPGIS